MPPGAAHTPHPKTTAEEIEEALADLSASREAWKALNIESRAALLDECAKLLEENLDEIAMDGVAVKGSHGVGLGEELYAPDFVYHERQ